MFPRIRPVIGGKEAISGTIPRAIIDPRDRKTEYQVYHGQEIHVNQAVGEARMALYGLNGKKPWISYTGREIRDMLWEIVISMQKDFDEFAYLETLIGKPEREAKEDVKAAIDTFKYYAGAADKITGSYFNEYPRSRRFTMLSPVGVCGLITSFNYPLLLMSWKVAPALACRNAILLKPPEESPFSSVKFAEIANKILPNGVFNVIPGNSEVGKALVLHPEVDMISFTGSTKTGDWIRQNAGSKKLTLELSSKNSIVVSSSVDLDSESLFDIILDASFANSGQNCCAASKLYVHESIYEVFLTKLEERVRNLTLCVPLANKKQFDKVMSYIQHGQSSLRILCGGNTTNERGYYIEPTVFVDVPEDHVLANEEIFGPVLSVMKRFTDMNQVISCVKRSEYNLAFGLISNSNAEIQKVVSEVNCGMVWINSYNDIPPYMPFGGSKSSGSQKELGMDALNEYSFKKSVIIN